MQRWLADVAALNNSLAVLEEEVRTGVADGYTRSTGYLDYNIASYKSTVYVSIILPLPGSTYGTDRDARSI